MATGRELPPKIANAPELWIGLGIYLSAFYELSSCRSIGMVEGPIPWTAIDRYCELYSIQGDQQEAMFFHVRNLDLIYAKFQSARRKAETR